MGYVALAAFVAVWIFVAGMGKARSWSLTMRHGGGFIAGAFAAALLGLFFRPGPSTDHAAGHVAESVEQTPAPKKGLGIDKERFAYQWNSISNNKIGAIEFKEGVATFRLSNSQILTLSNQSGGDKVGNVLLVLAPQTQLDALDVLINVPAIIAATHPDLAPARRGEIMKRLRMLGHDADYAFANGEETRVHTVGGVKYLFMRVAGVLMFGAEAAD